MKLKNVAKSNLDQLYEIKATLKIIKAKNSVDTQKQSQPNYRFIIGIPTEFRTGIYPKEITLTGIEPDSHWSCNWYDMYESEPSKEMIRLAKQVRDLMTSNKHLRDRNQALEKHFTRTSFDEQFENRHKKLEEPDCESCYNKIIMKDSILGKDYIYLQEGEIMHLDCASELFSSKCECGQYFEYDGEEGCPECGETDRITSMTKDEVKKGLQFNAIKKYLPKELQDKVILTSQSHENVEVKP